VALGLVAAACSSDTEAVTEDASPTFARANGSSLAFEEPVANVSDLLGPAAEGDPWTIVGSVFDPESRAAVATVWTSDDARDWEKTTVPPASKGTGESMAAAIATADGMLAAGQVGDAAEADAAIWQQVDGEWDQTRPEALGGDHEQWAFDVVAGEGGTLIAGGENVWGDVRPRLWFSADGETWTSVDGGPGGPLDATGEESVHDIAAVGAGFVAVGSRTLDNEQDGLVWYSPDGETWDQVDAPELAGPGRQDLMTVASTDGAVVAGGYSADGADGQGRPYVWHSADGLTWQAATDPLPMSDRRNAASDLSVRSITVGDQGLVAAGGNDWRPRVWHSADAGVTWEELPDPVHGEMFQDGVALRDAVGAQGVTVALGAEPSVLLLAGARWQDATGDTFPKGGAQPFATSVAVGHDAAIAAGGLYTAPSGDARATYAGQVWRTVDGRWEAVDSEHLAAGHVMDLAAFEGGFAAVGFEDFGLAHQREVVSDTEPDGLVWVSENGKDWARIGVTDSRINTEWLEYLEDPHPDQALAIAELEHEAPPQSASPAGGPGTRSLSAVAPISGGFIAVGSVYDAGDADPIVIVSPDGTQFSGETPAHAGAGIQRYNDVCVAPDDTAVAVGVTGSTGAYDIAVAQRQTDGAWVAAESESFGGPGSQQAYACAAGDDGFIIVGSDDRSGGTDARVWTSEDGAAWTEVASGLLGGSGDQWASAVTLVPDGGWLVAGTDTAAGDGDIALWRISSSGDMSRRDRGETALGGPGEQSVTNITIDDAGHVTLAGNDYGRVGLWESDTLDR
jgi:hypothetical protein